jgi:hypothetical protein
MATRNETCALSSDEMDAVSGGVQNDGCTKTGGFKFLGVKFEIFTCEDGGYAVSAQGKGIA